MTVRDQVLHRRVRPALIGLDERVGLEADGGAVDEHDGVCSRQRSSQEWSTPTGATTRPES
nr:hypothetical protein [Microbacterium sp. Se5.02b]